MFDMVAMLVAHLESIDLNLLPPLSALLEERHVTRPAHRSGLSQPAMSRALTRLRQQLDDQLLVRDKGGYVLTPRAERIQRQLAAVIDYSLILFLRQVAREVNTLSPSSTLRIEATGDAVFEDVLHGRIDL